jgi:hypothetical protein
VPSGLLPTFFDAYLGLPRTDWLELGKRVRTKPAAPTRRAARAGAPPAP